MKWNIILNTDLESSVPSTPSWYDAALFGADPDKPSDAKPVFLPSPSPRQQHFNDVESIETDRTISQYGADAIYMDPEQGTSPGIAPKPSASRHRVWVEITAMKDEIQALGSELLFHTSLNKVFLSYYRRRYAEVKVDANLALYHAMKGTIWARVATAALWKAIIHDKLGESKEVIAPLSLALIFVLELNDPDTGRLYKMLPKYRSEVNAYYAEHKKNEANPMSTETDGESHVDAKDLTEVDVVRQSVTLRRKNSWVSKTMRSLEESLRGQILPQTPDSFAISFQRKLRQDKPPTQQKLDSPVALLSPSVINPPRSPSGITLGSYEHVLRLLKENASLKEALFQHKGDYRGNQDPASAQDHHSMYQELYAAVQRPISRQRISVDNPDSGINSLQSERGRVTLLMQEMIQGKLKRSHRYPSLLTNVEHVLPVSSEEAGPQLSNSPIIITVSPRGKDRATSLASLEDAKMTDTPGGAKLDSLIERRNSTERRKSMSQVDTSLSDIDPQLLTGLAVTDDGRRPSVDFLSSPTDPSPLRESSTAEEEQEMEVRS